MNSFDKAIERLEKYGWIQGSYGSYLRGFCMVGAICWGRESYNLRQTEWVALGKAMDDIDSAGYPGVESWNDDDGRTKEDVVLALKHASRNYEELTGMTKG